MDFKVGKNIDTNLTHKQGVITVGYEKLVDTFGEPTYLDGDKTDADWNIEFADGTVATIYNWNPCKDEFYCPQDPTVINDWHIGGFSDDAVKNITEVLGIEKHSN